VGVGDALHTQSVANLASAARPDSILVRPDTPIVPLDGAMIDEANGTGRPMIAAATTVDGSRVRAAYVFAYQTGSAPTASFAPSALGLSGPVVIHDVFAGTAVRQDASAVYTHNVSGGTAFLVVVPVGPSGIAVVGDLGKYVSLGRARISSLVDDGKVHVGVAFAANETAVTLTGYAAATPKITATSGTADAPSFDAATGRFQVVVHPIAGSAALDIGA
jgi:hypothetical protein